MTCQGSATAFPAASSICLYDHWYFSTPLAKRSSPKSVRSSSVPANGESRPPKPPSPTVSPSRAPAAEPRISLMLVLLPIVLTTTTFPSGESWPSQYGTRGSVTRIVTSLAQSKSQYVPHGRQDR